MEIRATIPERDVARICEIQNQFDPEKLEPSHYLARIGETPAEWLTVRLSATEGEDLVGYAYSRRLPTMKPGVFLLTVGVDRAHEGRGIGSGLLDAVTRVSLELGCTRLVPNVRETHPGAERFFLKRGFETQMSLRESWLDLTNLDFGDVVFPEGYRLIRWSEVGDSEENRVRFYNMFTAMDADEPGTQLLGFHDRVSMEREAFDAELCDPETLYLLEFDGEWVAHHQVKRLEAGSWDEANIAFTGVMPEHRGKGLAKLLKRFGMRELQAKGTQRILTHNDSSNEPMLAINRKMGFVDGDGWLFMVKDL